MESKTALVILALFTSLSFNVDAAGQSHCASVYADATRNVDVYARTLTEQSAMFNQHCETNGSMRQSSASLDLTVPVEGIVVGFKGGKDAARSEVQNFCKRYHESLQRYDNIFRTSNFVVVDALRSFNQCRELETKEVRIVHLATDSRSLVVRVEFNPSNSAVTLRSVLYDENAAECVSDVSGESNTPVQFPMNPAVAKGPFSIACTRKAVTTASGSKKFDRLELLVDTNHGPYAIALPVEEMLGYDLASQNRAASVAAAQRQLVLESEVGTLKNEIDSLRLKMANPNVAVHSMRQGSGLGPSALDCHHDPKDYAKASCPAPGILTNIHRSQPESPGGACGYREWRWTCVSY